MKLWVIAMLLLASPVLATPVLFDNIPQTSSFYGKGAINFSVNITSDTFIQSSAHMYVISEDAYTNEDPWDNYSMSCVNYAANNWRCAKTVSFAIAGSDTQELLYFSAEDADANATLGSPASPLRFKIDRTGPAVTFISPANNSYVRGVVNVSISTSDGVSGVNSSLTTISVDGGAWIPMPGIYPINTSVYSDNYNLNVRINATDIVGNPSVTQLNLKVDNELPRIVVNQPTPWEKLSGTKTLSITVSDSYSGIRDVSFMLVGQTSMICSGSPNQQTCTYALDTSNYLDGNVTIVFFVSDNTTNLNSTSVNVTLKNSAPGLSLSPEGFVNGLVNAHADITNPDEIITAVLLKISSLNYTMTCNPGFTSCSYALDTRLLPDGPYTMSANATNILNSTIYDSKLLTIDNTPPNLTVNVPSVAHGVSTINANIVDANNDKDNVYFGLLGNQYQMTCVPQGQLMLCYIDYNFSQVSDGLYNVTVNTTDGGGNIVVKSSPLAVDNNPPDVSYVIIEPLNPSVAVGVTISAVIIDSGSGVKYANAVIRSSGSSNTLSMEFSGGAWRQVFYSSTPGAYQVDIIAEDNNGNVRTMSKAGYFFMGQLACGDGYCADNENYCLCPRDCAEPKCSNANMISCGSGIPRCVPVANCGDKVCSVGETCLNCAKDCGVCPATNQSVTTQGGQDIVEAVTNVYSTSGQSFPVILTSGVIIIFIVIIAAMVLRKKKK